jgi:hypothetical protein
VLSFKKFLNKPVKDIPELAGKFKVDSTYLETQLERGIKVETEHTSDKNIARQIALAHLGEKPNYYELLDKYVEKGKSND